VKAQAARPACTYPVGQAEDCRPILRGARSLASEDFGQPQEPGDRECGQCSADIGIDLVSTGVFVDPHRQNQRGKNRHHSIADPACEVEETTVEGSAIHASPRALMYASVFGLCQKSGGWLARVENAHQPGETGVVISRYSRIRKLDWVAVPLLPYLYAVEKAEDVPGWVEAATVETMRKDYAEAHLESLVSLTQGYDKKNVWPQLLGVAYIRKLYSFAIATTEEQDDLLIGEYNERENHSHFNLFTNNCADFSKHLLNFYYPHAVHRSITADIAITTPKQVAKSLAAYALHHDQLELNEIIIPQIPGSFPRSHTPRGIMESLLKTKKYALPIVVFHP
jgi:hypothetical protein